MGIHAQGQEAEQVVQVYLPVPLGIQGQRQVYPGQFLGQAGIDQLLVVA
jgi:hypothetical protein